MLNIKVIQGDCLAVLKRGTANSIDSLITDPPAGISFMNKEWDDDKGGRDGWIAWLTEVAAECMRVMKPGAHGLVWAIPRTSHWTATALENAGFEVRDVVTHLFGTGFPKSLNIQKQIESSYSCRLLNNAKPAENQYPLIPVESNGETIGFVAVSVATPHAAGLEKLMVIGGVEDLSAPTGILQFESTEPIDLNTILSLKQVLAGVLLSEKKFITLTKLKTITDLKIWNLLQKQSTLPSMPGAGTALKPASEHWILVRKPLSEKTVAANVLKWGVGGLNIDASRIGTDTISTHGGGDKMSGMKGNGNAGVGEYKSHVGRFPANLVLSHNEDCEIKNRLHELERATHSFDNATEYVGLIAKHDNCTKGCAVATLDAQSGILKSGNLNPGHKRGDGPNVPYGGGGVVTGTYGGDSGGASRFFYVAKASTSEKNSGLEEMPDVIVDDGRQTSIDNPYLRGETKRKNTHPTVKSLKLMEYLIKLITPPGGKILDPFMGSGSTGLAAKNLGFDFVGIEKETEYFEIAKARIGVK